MRRATSPEITRCRSFVPVHRLNLQIHQAVEAGAFVELMRGHRVHNGRTKGANQMVPITRIPDVSSKE
jgi:hypothetical protein